jgi:signal transduction histidine kinase
VEDNSVATHLFRIAQEAINNAIRHGRPKNVFVHLEDRDNLVSLLVLDDGIGIAGEQNRSEGMGLRIMRYRADIIGAHFSVNSLEGGGTIVSCNVDKGKLETGEVRHT